MAKKNWRKNYAKKHGHEWQPENVNQKTQEIISDEQTIDVHYCMKYDDYLDYGFDPELKQIKTLTINYPEGTKDFCFENQCTLLGKILDGEFILMDNITKFMMIASKKALIILNHPSRFKNTDSRKKYIETDNYKYNDKIIWMLMQLTDESLEIEQRLRIIGLYYMYRIDSIGYKEIPLTLNRQKKN